MNKPVQQKQESGGGSMFASLAIIIALVISVLIYIFVMGNPNNFEGGNSANHPLPDSIFGLLYKGGVIVPILMSLLILVVTFSIERFMTINKASGKIASHAFLSKIRSLLSTGNVDAVSQECDRQQGSLGAVVKSAMGTYKEVGSDTTLDKEQKIVAIQKSIEEATELELPMLQRNLVIISTIASIGTLIALLGTVLGMIKSFRAMATAGAADSVALSAGISEALINTAFGIGTSALAIIVYNYFTTKIDSLTYSIDEAGFSILSSFAQSHK
jgi:biopolymer transport protein ExbB